MSAAPTARIMRRPSASATMVSTKLMATSPASVSVMNSPACEAECPSALRNETRMSVEAPYAKGGRTAAL